MNGAQEPAHVLFTETTDISPGVSVVVQGFAGSVELSAVRDTRSARCEVIEELPPLLPQEARTLAGNLSHTVRRDPFRVPMDGDEWDGTTTMQATLSRITCKRDEDVTRIRIYAFIEPTSSTPGELVTIPNIRRTSALKIAEALDIAARCAETGETYQRSAPEPVPEPQPECQDDEETPAARPAVPLELPAPPDPPRMHPATAARLARVEARERGEDVPAPTVAQRNAARFDRAGQRAEWLRKRAGIAQASPAPAGEEPAP